MVCHVEAHIIVISFIRDLVDLIVDEMLLFIAFQCIFEQARKILLSHCCLWLR